MRICLPSMTEVQNESSPNIRSHQHDPHQHRNGVIITINCSQLVWIKSMGIWHSRWEVDTRIPRSENLPPAANTLKTRSARCTPSFDCSAANGVITIHGWRRKCQRQRQA